MHPKVFAVILLLAGGMLPAAAQTDRVVFNFTGADPARSLPWTATSVLESGLTTQGWTMGSGLSLVSARSNRIAFAVSAGDALSTLEEARAEGAYLNVRLSSTSGPLQLDSNRIRFTIRRESWHAPLRFAVYSSTDNFASPVFVSEEVEQLDDGTHHFSFFLPNSGFTALSGPVDFRIYPFAARYSGHALSLTAFSLGAPVQTYTLAATATEGGAVQVSPSGSVFEAGQLVQLTARADAGYAFTGWSGDANGTDNPLTRTINGNLAITANFLPRPSPRMDLGGNLEALVDWTTAWVFKDCFKLSREWLTRTTTGNEWESNQTPPLDTDGWPLAVPFAANSAQHFVHTLLPLYGPGDYTVRFEGAGRIELIAPNGGGRQVMTATGGTTTRIFTFNPTLADNILYLELRQSESADPVRRIEVIAPGQDSNLQTEPFHPDFITSLAPYRNLRFMDWMQTNLLPWETVEPLQSWSERTTATSYTQTRRQGAAHEYIIALANQTGKDPWICLPHEADDDYVRQTARLYRDTLDPDLELYVEYSNETWNGGFMQTTYVQDRGQALGLDASRWQAAQKFVARRSAEIFSIFAGEYGTAQRHRLVAVLATQAANAGLSEERLAAFNDPVVNTTGQHPDALAIAPYFGVNYEPGQPVPTAEQVATTLSTSSIAEALGWTGEQRAVAEANGLRLICYEGGQHFVGILGAESNGALNAALHAGNRDPRMQDRYREYLTGLEQLGVDLFVNFTHVGEWSQYGSWGVLEYQQQPPAAAPKWRALTAWHDQLQQRREEVRVAPPAIPGGDWSAAFPLRPGRLYGVVTSTNLESWLPVEGLQDLRGDTVTTRVALPAASEPQRFWRVMESQ
ncbi:MAG: InlB B-repeat-containing protein [Chthoniobacterales bacterium]